MPHQNPPPDPPPPVYLLLTRAAGVQFNEPITVRLVRVNIHPTTSDDHMWVDCIEIDQYGNDRARRELYIRTNGARRLRAPRQLNTAATAPPPRPGPGTNQRTDGRRG